MRMIEIGSPQWRFRARPPIALSQRFGVQIGTTSGWRSDDIVIGWIDLIHRSGILKHGWDSRDAHLPPLDSTCIVQYVSDPISRATYDRNRG